MNDREGLSEISFQLSLSLILSLAQKAEMEREKHRDKDTDREREKAEETGRRTGAREIERGGDAEAHGAFSFGCGRLGGTDTIVFQYIWLRTLATPKKNIGNA